VQHLAEELDEDLVRAPGQVEAVVVEDPIVVPVVRIVDPVLPDVSGGVLEAVILRGQFR